MTEKHIDHYSIMIASKYFERIEDFINLELAVKRFEGNMERFHYNPIPLNDFSMNFFPNLETLHVYDKMDQLLYKGRIFKYCFWFRIDYEQSQKEKRSDYKMICYTTFDRQKYGNVIPNNVKILGYSCFENCGLTSIKIPNSVTELGDNCFKNCTSLASIIIPNSVVKLGEKCFYNCKSLKSIDLPTSIYRIKSNCFNGCSSLKSIEIPSSITKFGKSCFYSCEHLKNNPQIPEVCFIADNKKNLILPNFNL